MIEHSVLNVLRLFQVGGSWNYEVQ